MVTKINSDELAERLTDVLDEVKATGNAYVIERDGEEIAAITRTEGQPGITWAEFVALLRDAPRPDPEFADDLEEIQASQRPAEFPEWPE